MSATSFESRVSRERTPFARPSRSAWIRLISREAASALLPAAPEATALSLGLKLQTGLFPFQVAWPVL